MAFRLDSVAGPIPQRLRGSPGLFYGLFFAAPNQGGREAARFLSNFQSPNNTRALHVGPPSPLGVAGD